MNQELTFQDILNKKIRLEKKYYKKIFEDYNKTKKSIEIRSGILVIIGMILIMCAFIIPFIILDNGIISIFVHIVIFITVSMIVFYIYGKTEENENQVLKNIYRKCNKKIQKKIHKKMKNRYDVEVYPDHIKYNNQIFISPENWHINIDYIDENNYTFNFSYEYIEKHNYIQNKYQISNADYVDFIKLRGRWIKLESQER